MTVNALRCIPDEDVLVSMALQGLLYRAALSKMHGLLVPNCAQKNAGTPSVATCLKLWWVSLRDNSHYNATAVGENRGRASWNASAGRVGGRGGCRAQQHCPHQGRWAQLLQLLQSEGGQQADLTSANGMYLLTSTPSSSPVGPAGAAAPAVRFAPASSPGGPEPAAGATAAAVAASESAGGRSAAASALRSSWWLKRPGGSPRTASITAASAATCSPARAPSNGFCLNQFFQYKFF